MPIWHWLIDAKPKLAPAEEEEARLKQLEAKTKKKEKAKQDSPKPECNKKTEQKKPEAAKKNEKEQKKGKEELKKEQKKQEKSTEKTNKPKDNRQEKNVSTSSSSSKKEQKQSSQQQSSQSSANGKKKNSQTQEKPRVINITPDTTIEVVGKKGTCSSEAEKPPSCSIMEQLSSGVQVADLKLPPGITLTRVQPNEKKESPVIKSVPLWKCSQLPATPTPVARPPPVISAQPSLMMFSTAQPEPPRAAPVPEPPAPPAAGKSKKAKKKAKKAGAASETSGQPTAQTSKGADGTKMVTLRNPMFHPNLPPVQLTNQPPTKKMPESIRIPEPIPMPPNACQATITPTSNGMYTIRNPLMSLMHQQSLMGVRAPTPQMNPVMMPQQPQYAPPGPTYVTSNIYSPTPNAPPTFRETSPKIAEDPKRTQTSDFNPNQTNISRVVNLESFTQKNDDGYSLFKTPEDTQKCGFLVPEGYSYHETNGGTASPKKSGCSPNPIGTRPAQNTATIVTDTDSSLFTNSHRPEPIGTPYRKAEDEVNACGLYTPFGQNEETDFRSALFQDKGGLGTARSGGRGVEEAMPLVNGDPLPYFQRLRVGSKLNSEVTIHHVSESKFFKGQEPAIAAAVPQLGGAESLASKPDDYRPYPPTGWAPGVVSASPCNSTSSLSSAAGPAAPAGSASGSESPRPAPDAVRAHPYQEEEIAGFGAIGQSAVRNGMRRDQAAFYPGSKPGTCKVDARNYRATGARPLKRLFVEMGSFTNPQACDLVQHEYRQSADLCRCEGSHKMRRIGVNRNVQRDVSRMRTAPVTGNTEPPRLITLEKLITSVFVPDRSITNLNELESSERDIESFKRFEFYFEPPKHKPRVQFNVHDIAAQLRARDHHNVKFIAIQESKVFYVQSFRRLGPAAAAAGARLLCGVRRAGASDSPACACAANNMPSCDSACTTKL
ncbi:hypothetical protein EVAR_62533_1 [Eumeta japonica]|uniref:Uncharacterized protein n=1 Tax=Eumeta variegata TaxID=151549 RepID=A0A4C1ZF79_EUMVA|nr:hypothetical protein EVAR_62533_1 [Eumeta japonica]